MTTNKKRLNLKDKYRYLTRDLGWEPSYQKKEDVFPLEHFEGIKITDWDKWEDPFRLTMDSYWKHQAEKEKKLYAIFDAFAQNNGHQNISDARYVNALKLFLTGVSPLEYQAFQGFSRVGRQFSGAGARVACQMQAIDELRHVQTQLHAMSHYNKHFDGLHDFAHMYDRVWFLSVCADRRSVRVPHRRLVLLRVRADQPVVRTLHVRCRLQRRYGHGHLRFLRAVGRGAAHDPGSGSDQVHARTA